MYLRTPLAHATTALLYLGTHGIFWQQCHGIHDIAFAFTRLILHFWKHLRINFIGWHVISVLRGNPLRGRAQRPLHGQHAAPGVVAVNKITGSVVNWIKGSVRCSHSNDNLAFPDLSSGSTHF